MGAALGKAAEDFAGDASRARAAARRLAVAEHAILQWNRSPGADSGIWDAAARYTDRPLLSAVDEVLLLAEEDPFPAASSGRRRLDGAVAAAMSRVMEEEFPRVRVWDASHPQLRAAVDRMALASSGASLMVLPSAGGRTTSTASTCDASDGTHSRSSSGVVVPDEAAAQLADGQFLDELDLVCPAAVSVLHEIALRVVRAGRTKDFFRAFSYAPCDVLDRFLSILRVECSRRTTEVVIKRWTLVARLTCKAVAAMEKQLHAQKAGAFDGFRDEYLLAVAESRVSVLLRFADEFTGIASHDKLVYVLAMYEALSDAAPGLVLLLGGRARRSERVAGRAQDILARLASAIRRMASGLVAAVRTGGYPREPTSAAAAADGVHPLARHAMDCVEMLALRRAALDVVLATSDGGEDGRGGGADQRVVSSFGGLVSELIAGTELNLEGKPAVTCGEAGGSPHLFLANNASYVLTRATDAGVAGSLLGDDHWAARRRGRIEQHAESYVEACWGPVAARLGQAGGGGVKAAKALARFNAAFEDAHGGQAWREVPDPALRATLRQAVSERIVPAYAAFLQKHPKLGKSVRYTADDLAELVSELFEGEAASGKKS